MVRVLRQEDPRRVGERGAHGGQRLAQRSERLDLTPIDRITGLFRADQMAHDQGRLESVEAHVAMQRQTLRDREAEPVHSGVHVDRRGQLQRLRATEFRPFVDLVL
jgi:hypothetical protein